MTVSTRTRFEVFKRDRFTCAYCGRTPPEVLLHVDHVTPRAAGGNDDMENLITACATCNQGKAARLLDEGSSPVVGKASVEEAAERLAQARAYAEVSAELRRLLEDQVHDVIRAWAVAFHATTEVGEDGTSWLLHGSGAQFPMRSSIRNLLRRLPVDVLLDSVDVVATRFDVSTEHACRYFYAVCWRIVRDREGRA